MRIGERPDGGQVRANRAYCDQGNLRAAATDRRVPGHLECRLLDVIRVGDHDLFTGEVLAQHVDEDALSGDGAIDIDKLRPFAFMLDEYRAIGGRIARR